MSNATKNLRVLWRESGLTQSKLAKLIGIKERTLNGYLNSDNPPPYSVELSVKVLLLLKYKPLIFKSIICYGMYLDQQGGSSDNKKVTLDYQDLSFLQNSDEALINVIDELDVLLSKLEEKEARYANNRG